MTGTASVPARGEPEGVRFLEHTADTGVEARGRSLEECFARAAAGMFASAVRPARGSRARRQVSVEVRAGSESELLVAWLEELLYQSEARGLALLRFEARELEGGRLRGRAWGAPLAEAEIVGPGIKAVTRHGLEVARTPGHVRARVIFDV